MNNKLLLLTCISSLCIMAAGCVNQVKPNHEANPAERLTTIEKPATNLGGKNYVYQSRNFSGIKHSQNNGSNTVKSNIQSVNKFSKTYDLTPEQEAKVSEALNIAEQALSLALKIINDTNANQDKTSSVKFNKNGENNA